MTLTNILLGLLITILSFMGRALYEKIEHLIEEIRTIMMSDVANKKDIEYLKDSIDDHEERLTKLENK
jgi:polyhydroxyalkanoate synthesis regulator phasin